MLEVKQAIANNAQPVACASLAVWIWTDYALIVSAEIEAGSAL